jgi:hypothetical protein
LWPLKITGASHQSSKVLVFALLTASLPKIKPLSKHNANHILLLPKSIFGTDWSFIFCCLQSFLKKSGQGHPTDLGVAARLVVAPTPPSWAATPLFFYYYFF